MGGSKTEFGLEEFEKILDELGRSHISIAPKLSTGHIYVNGQDKQRVRCAAQLLSSSTAQAARELFPTDQKMQELAQFLQAVGMFQIKCSLLCSPPSAEYALTIYNRLLSHAGFSHFRKLH